MSIKTMIYISEAHKKRITVNDLSLLSKSREASLYFYDKKTAKIGQTKIGEILKNPNNNHEFYLPYEINNTSNIIHEGKPPSYHMKIDCIRLNAKFESYKIPNEIENTDNDTIKEFKHWFVKNEHLLKESDIFLDQLKERWGINRIPDKIIIDNSGPIEFNNLPLLLKLGFKGCFECCYTNLETIFGPRDKMIK